MSERAAEEAAEEAWAAAEEAREAWEAAARAAAAIAD